MWDVVLQWCTLFRQLTLENLLFDGSSGEESVHIHKFLLSISPNLSHKKQVISLSLYEIFLDINSVKEISRFYLDCTVASDSISHREILDS